MKFSNSPIASTSVMLILITACSYPPAEEYKLVEQKRYPEAIALCSSVIAKNPKDQSAYGIRAYAYRQLKEYKKAIDDYTRFIELQPDDLRVFLDRGTVYYQLGLYKEAIADFSKEIEVVDQRNKLGWNIDAKPEGFLLVTYDRRANAYEKLGNRDLALSDRTKAQQLKSRTSTVPN